MLRIRYFAYIALVSLILGGLAPHTAHAEGSDDTQSYWFVSFVGGIASPSKKSPLADDRVDYSLTAFGRVGFTGKTGIGFAFSVSYSPLDVDNDTLPGGTTSESLFSTMTASPRFTLGKRKLRIWISAGGGVLLDRTATKTRGNPKVIVYNTEPAAVVESGVELHLFNNGGLTASVNYTQSFGDLDAKLYHYLAGLVFTFE